MRIPVEGRGKLVPWKSQKETTLQRFQAWHVKEVKGGMPGYLLEHWLGICRVLCIEATVFPSSQLIFHILLPIFSVKIAFSAPFSRRGFLHEGNWLLRSV